MPAILVSEPVIDALLLQQSADEIKVRFTVLDAVLPGLMVAAADLQLEVVEAILLDDLFKDLRDRLSLENPAIRCARQEP